MNTSKQVNVMIGLLFLAFLGFAAYIGWENTRAADAEEAQRDMFAERGAALYFLNCANCHGIEGRGTEEGGFGIRINRDAFLILREDNPHGAPETPFGEAEEIREFLFNSIACGRHGTLMPPWHERFGGPLSEIQVNYIVTLITEGRWDLVQEEWEDYLAHQDPPETDSEEARQEYLLDAPPGVTEGACGQYGDLVADFRDRDPFVEAGVTPEPPDDDDGPPVDEEGLVQGMEPGQYFSQTCAACHGPDRGGIEGLGLPLTPSAMTEAPEFYKNVLREGRNAMPAWGAGAPLSEEELDALVEYLMTVEP